MQAASISKFLYLHLNLEIYKCGQLTIKTSFIFTYFSFHASRKIDSAPAIIIKPENTATLLRFTSYVIQFFVFFKTANYSMTQPTAAIAEVVFINIANFATLFPVCYDDDVLSSSVSFKSLNHNKMCVYNICERVCR